MSAIRESGDAAEPINVLVALHNQMSLLDFAGPMEILNAALHNNDDPGTPFPLSPLPTVLHIPDQC
jgi:hypothetical protein